MGEVRLDTDRLTLRPWDDDVIEPFAAPANRQSRALVGTFGMRYVGDGDFDHSLLGASDPLRRPILYRIERPANA